MTAIATFPLMTAIVQYMKSQFFRNPVHRAKPNVPEEEAEQGEPGELEG